MADGGASTFIMLITGLLISSSVSALLITEWSAMARVAQKNQQGITFNSELGIDFAGDPMMVDVETNPTGKITFYLQNIGEHTMDHTKMEVLVNGVAPTSSPSATPVTGSSWDSNELVKIEIVDSAYGTSPFATGDDIRLYTIVSSNSVSGMYGSASMNVEVRLS